MKKTHILIILICCLNISFYSEKELTNRLNEEHFIQNEADSIIGKYYVENFDQNLKEGLILLKYKPKSTYGVFEFDFKENGNIKVTDLTEIYLCGNGVLYMNSAKWKKIENNVYSIVFNGGFSFWSTFEIDAICLLEEKFDSKTLKIKKFVKNKTKNTSEIIIDPPKKSKKKK
jgi:hypothetical protein